MFKHLPANPALIQKLRIRNRVASLVSFGLLLAYPILSSFIITPENVADAISFFVVMQVVGLIIGSLLIPSSVFFFTHALRYKKLLAHLGTNPAVFAATEPAPSDLKKLGGKKMSAIVWHSVTLGVPVIWAVAATAANGQAEALTAVMILGVPLVMSALTAGMVMSAVSINGYLTFKAQLRWAFPDAQAWSAASTSKTS